MFCCLLQSKNVQLITYYLLPFLYYLFNITFGSKLKKHGGKLQCSLALTAKLNLYVSGVHLFSALTDLSYICWNACVSYYILYALGIDQLLT